MSDNLDHFSFSGRIRSVNHAVDGPVEMLKGQHNARVHLAATIVVIFIAAILQVTTNRWCLLVLSIVFVWMAEALNTAFEFLCDVASPEFHPLVKKSKDVAAGAVLISAVGATLIAVIVFTPHIAKLF